MERDFKNGLIARGKLKSAARDWVVVYGLTPGPGMAEMQFPIRLKGVGVQARGEAKILGSKGSNSQQLHWSPWRQNHSQPTA